jgi:xanthine dehydrogenase accessory factor
MSEIYTILKQIQSASQECILATIVQVNGSSYMKEGTSMLIKEDGDFSGFLSPGCLDEDLFLQAQKVFKDKKTRTYIYNLKEVEDSGWGTGMGCPGELSILLEYIDDALKADLMVLYEELSKGNSVLHQKIFTADHFTLLASGLLTKKQIEHKQTIVGEYKESIYLYRQLFRPKPCLIIFGAGPDVNPVVQLASRAGFSVTVCDWRPSLCHKDNLPDADQCILGFPEEIFDRLVIHQDDFVVIMTHNFRRDQEIISKIMKQPPRYVGILGSKQRTQNLFRNNVPSEVHYPIGISIGAEEPFEIAISIVAEIIKFTRMNELVR